MDYRKGKIYKILNTLDDDCYVGSTTQTLSKRMTNHRKDMLSEVKKDRLLYTKMRIHGADNFYIELIEDYPCENIEQLRQREGYYIRELGTLNRNVAGRTKQEWTTEHIDHKKELDKKRYMDNHESELAYRKEYRENNKEKLRELKKKHYEENKEEILQKQKDRYNEHRERIREQHHRYREQNIEKIRQWESTKILCSCGIEYTQANRLRHCRSQRHKQLLEQQSSGDPE
jgi:group I intron endonuclease